MTTSLIDHEFAGVPSNRAREIIMSKRERVWRD
jgi:hypothetical protein